MKNAKILLKISLFCMSFAFVQAGVTIGEGTRKYAKQNAAKIAQQFVAKYPNKSMIAEQDLSEILQEDLDNLFSANGLQYVLGSVQAQIDQGMSGFSPSVKTPKNNAMPVDRIRPWIQKHQAKIVNYLNNNNVRKAGFKAIEEACTALKIKLPQGDLSDQEKKDIAEEITVAIHLVNPDTNKSFGEKYFSARQYKYIEEYIVPKLIAAGYSSLSVQDFENFLDKLPQKSHTGVSVENTFAKLAHHRKKDFVEAISATLVGSINNPKMIAKIAEVLRVLQRIAQEEDAK